MRGVGFRVEWGKRTVGGLGQSEVSGEGFRAEWGKSSGRVIQMRTKNFFSLRNFQLFLEWN